MKGFACRKYDGKIAESKQKETKQNFHFLNFWIHSVQILVPSSVCEMSFVHLHTHTHYSFLQGLGTPKKLVYRAKELEMSAIAITDTGNLYGAFEFYKYAKEAGIKPII